MDYHFSSDLLSEVKVSDYLHWEVSAKQFKAIQEKCSGRSIPANWEGAQHWARERSNFLHNLATKHEEETGEYDQPNSYCTYAVGEDFVIHQTTSGSLFMITREGQFTISLPINRSGGTHHKSILLVLGGITNEQRDQLEKIYLLPRDTPIEVKESIYAEMKTLYDPILVPHGFKPEQTYQELQAEIKTDRSRLGESWPEAVEDIGDYEDYEE